MKRRGTVHGEGSGPRLLLVDNYDSFTFNLVQLLGELGAAGRGVPQRRRSTWPGIRRARARRAGPLARPLHARRGRRDARRHPRAGRRAAHPRASASGTSAIGQAFGGKVVRNVRIVHGKCEPGAPPAARGSTPACPCPSRPAATTRWWSSASALPRGARASPPGPRRARSWACATGRSRSRASSSTRSRSSPPQGKLLLGNWLAASARPSGATPRPWRPIRDPASHREALDRQGPHPRRDGGGDGRDRRRRRHPGAGGRLPGGAPAQGRDGGRDRRRRPGDARPRRPGPRRHGRSSSTPAAPAATAGTPSTSPPPRPSRWPAPACCVAKHGNRAVSSRCRLGRRAGRAGRERRRAQGGGGALPSPRWASASSSRPGSTPRSRRWPASGASWRVRTVFNLLGPLANPAGARHQVMGVYEARWVPVSAGVLATLGARPRLRGPRRGARRDCRSPA